MNEAELRLRAMIPEGLRDKPMHEIIHWVGMDTTRVFKKLKEVIEKCQQDGLLDREDEHDSL